MKKFTSLLLLLLTMFLWGGVNAMAQSFTVSDAPSDGAWAKNTHWYTIKTHTSDRNASDYFYLCTNEKGTAPNGCLVINATDKSADGIWCVVKDGNGNYQFYNYVEGPNKVLGMTGEEQNGRAKMYVAGTTEDGVTKSFTYTSTATSPDGNVAAAFKVPSTTKQYWNNRNGYLAFWADNGAVTGSSSYGSAFVFEAISDEEIASLVSARYTSLVSTANNVKSQMANHVGDLFSYTNDQLTTLASLIPAAMPTETLKQAKTIRDLKDFFTSANASVVMPTAGKKYALKNAKYNRYIDCPISYSDGVTPFGVETLKRQRECWVLEAGSSEGLYRLKNAVTGNYIKGSSTVKDPHAYFSTESYGMYLGSYQEFRLYPNLGGRPLTVQIGTGDNYNNLHMNETYSLVEWETAEPSSWYLEEVSDEKYASLESEKKVLDAFSTSRILPVKDAVSSTLNAYNATPSEENASAFIDAVEASTYVRLKNVGNNLTLGAESQPHGYTWSEKDVNLIWKLELIDDRGTKKIKLHHLNTGKYMSAVGQIGGQGQNANLTDKTNGAVWNFTNNDGKFTIVDGAYGTLHCEDNGNINKWHQSDNAKWYVTLATDIQVDLKAVGDYTYATTFLPFPVRAVSEGVKAYTGSYDADKKLVTLKETAAIPVNTGVVLMGETASATTATLTIGGNATMTEGEKNDFDGTTTAIALDDNNRSNYLVLGRKSGAQSEVGFFRPLADQIFANRAYIRNVNGNAVSSVSVNFGTVEGIGSVVTETAEDANSPIFDLSGRRVMHTVKGGLYIRNGKKFLVK